MSTVTLGAENFEEMVTSNDIVFVDFWASWCGPCRMFAPIYEKAAEENSDIVFGSVNTEEEQALATGAQVSSIPTLMVFKQGALVFNQAGALPAPALNQVIQAVRDFEVPKEQSPA